MMSPLNLTLPTFIFGSMVAWLIGAMVHLIAGGKLVRLVFSMAFAWIGFWAGNSLAVRFELDILHFGQVIYGLSVPFAIVFSLFGYWLSGENKEPEE